jgi:hypothetical protein
VPRDAGAVRIAFDWPKTGADIAIDIAGPVMGSFVEPLTME